MSTDLYRLVVDFGAAFNRHDADALISMMTEDAVFFTVAGTTPFGNKIVGQADIKKAFEGVWAVMPDANWAAGDVIISGDRGVTDWVFTGTNATNQEFIEAQGCDIFTFRDGKIAVKNAFRKQIVT